MNLVSHKTNICKRCKREMSIYNFRLIDIPQMKQVPVSHCNECENLILNRFKMDERKYKLKIRIKIINLLGGKCACCGITQWWNLTADHIIPIKGKKRDSLCGFYKKLVENPEYIKEFQCLCFGCNGSKHTGAKCQLDHDFYNKIIKEPLVIIEPNTKDDFWDS